MIQFISWGHSICSKYAFHIMINATSVECIYSESFLLDILHGKCLYFMNVHICSRQPIHYVQLHRCIRRSKNIVVSPVHYLGANNAKKDFPAS